MMQRQRLTPRPTVFVVDDDPAVRRSLRWLIESTNLEVRTFASAHEFLNGYCPAAAACLVLDVRMPGMSGIELQEMLAARRIDLPVIVITGHGDVALAVRAMKAGAVDFVEKPFDDQVLLHRIQQALERGLSRERENARSREIAARLLLLSPREREVMDMVVTGVSSREVATELGVSLKTVESHRARIMEKMQARNLADLVRLAMACAPPDQQC